MGMLEKIVNLFMSDDKTVPVRELGRNEACWCGSGKKYKKCHLHPDQEAMNKNRSMNCGTN